MHNDDARIELRIAYCLLVDSCSARKQHGAVIGAGQGYNSKIEFKSETQSSVVTRSSECSIPIVLLPALQSACENPRNPNQP
jgi:hypothetical protein